MNIKIKPETIVRKYGYEYHLVEVIDRDKTGVREPSFMGMRGFALRSVNKIKK